jgi:hypothetical protein
MSDEGRDWIARKLGNGATTLRFATRSAGHVFAYDTLGKPMNRIPTSAPIAATDNRPTAGFDFSGPPNAPRLNLANRTLVLTASDRLLLSNSNFDVLDSNQPDMGMPVPTNNNRVTGFSGKVVLHDIDSGANTVLQFQPLDITVNNGFASTSVTLKLTDDDFNRVLELYKANSSPIWRMSIAAGTFSNLWGTTNTAYLPSGTPGAIAPIDIPAGYDAAELAACAMTDKPPVSQKNAAELTFDIEVFPPRIDGVVVPVQSQIIPAARIVNQLNGSVIAAGTFVNYSERTVAGRLRSIFRFTNAAGFAANLQRVPATVELNGITDIFGNPYSVTASYAYDLNSRSDSAADLTDAASAPIEIDTRKPLVTSIIPSDVIGRIPAGSIFKVNFDETMDPGVIPILRLASGTSMMAFTFAGWTATATADFTNDTAFTSALVNGIWYYQVTGGQDNAGNTHAGTAANAFPVQVRTYAPEVNPGSITLYTVQNTLSTARLTNQPWASIVGDGIFSIQYSTPPDQFLPHYFEIFDPATSQRLGRATIIANAATGMATATFRDTDFYAPPVYPGLTGPRSLAFRIIDSALNQTETLGTLVYDNLAPDVTSFSLSGIGSSTADTWYYRSAAGNFTADAVTASTLDDLRLAIYSHASVSTSTVALSQNLHRVTTA